MSIMTSKSLLSGYLNSANDQINLVLFYELTKEQIDTTVAEVEKEKDIKSESFKYLSENLFHTSMLLELKKALLWRASIK